VRLTLVTDGFTYQKWGGIQRCKPGDWIVDNDGDVYSVDAEVFARTYRQVAPGNYEKHSVVYVERATNAGAIDTKEGSTNYEAGDYLVFNDEQGTDGYAISASKFHRLYEPATPASGG
jgi:hypothetical protein